MPSFSFVARDASGSTLSGTREAATEALALSELRRAGLVILRLTSADRPAAGAAQRTRFWPGFGPRALDVEVGLHQIAFMLRSGLPLLSALRTCAAQSERRSMARVWIDVSERIQNGASLCDALSHHACFPRIVLTMVAVGERTGNLDLVLTRASQAMQRQRALMMSLATALTYPAIVVTMSIGVVIYMMVGLMPKLTKFLAAFGKRLPPMTQLLVDTSNFMQAHFVHGAILLIVLAVAFLALRAWPPGRIAIDRVLLRIPLIGNLLNLAATATLSRNLGLMLSSGVRLTEALRVVEPVLFNRYLGRHVAAARERVLQGAGLSDTLTASGAFNPMLTNMVAVGESSGTLDEVLEQVAEYHDTRLQVLIRRLGTIIEPAIIIVLGGIVGFIYMAFFLAIYAIAGGR
jgi:type IV pilus assembly protein PilC